MQKILLFLSLFIHTCQASATDRSYLIGEHSSSLYAEVGSPIEKMENRLTGKSIWTFKDFKILLRNDHVIQVKDLRTNQVFSKQHYSPIKQLPTDLGLEPKVDNVVPEVKENIISDVMSELKAKSEKSASPRNSTSPSARTNLLKLDR